MILFAELRNWVNNSLYRKGHEFIKPQRGWSGFPPNHDSRLHEEYWCEKCLCFLKSASGPCPGRKGA